jgi:hypothetical protein
MTHSNRQYCKKAGSQLHYGMKMTWRHAHGKNETAEEENQDAAAAEAPTAS